MKRQWTPAEVIALVLSTVTIDLVTAGSILGFGSTKSYELAKAGDFPVPVLKRRSQYVVPTAPILAAIGLTPDTDEPEAPPSGCIPDSDIRSPHDNDNALRAV